MSGAADRNCARGLQPGVLILAGGQGRRCGGFDKGWIEIGGEALVVRRLRELSGNYWPIAISANRTLDRYRSLGVPVFVDREPGFAGPLAAISTALHEGFGCPLVSVPVDAMVIPGDVLHALLDASESGTRAAYACDLDGAQPLVAVWPRDSLGIVDSALHSGQRAVHAVQSRLRAIAVDFPATRFGNFNSMVDIEAPRRADRGAATC